MRPIEPFLLTTSSRPPRNVRDEFTLLQFEAARIRREHDAARPCPKCGIEHLGSA